MTEEALVRERLSMLPTIRRARLWRLYAEDAAARPGRFLDLWMDGGRALLGAKGSGIGTAAKAAIDMGLLRPMPSAWERRLCAQLRIAYPEYEAARFFLTEERALAAIGHASAFDPARRGSASSTGAPSDSGSIPILRPFGELLGAASAIAAPIAMPLVPCPSALAPSILLFRDPKAAATIQSDILPPLRLAAAHRALCELVRMGEWYGEALWKKSDRRLSPHFERSGPYLYSRSGGEDYGAAFAAALGAGVLLSPDPELPSIVPGDFDDGEFAALAAALSAI